MFHKITNVLSMELDNTLCHKKGKIHRLLKVFQIKIKIFAICYWLNYIFPKRYAKVLILSTLFGIGSLQR